MYVPFSLPRLEEKNTRICWRHALVVVSRTGKEKKKLTLKATQKKREKEKFKQKKKKVIASHRNLTRSMC